MRSWSGDRVSHANSPTAQAWHRVVLQRASLEFASALLLAT